MNKRRPIYSLPRILDYVHKRMHTDERHAFEKQMQKDPFLNDATEGFAHADERTIKEDIDSINRLLLPKKQKPFGFYVSGIAATMTLFIVIGSVYYYVNLGLKEKAQLGLALETQTEVIVEEEYSTVDGDVVESERKKVTGDAFLGEGETNTASAKQSLLAENDKDEITHPSGLPLASRQSTAKPSVSGGVKQPGNEPKPVQEENKTIVGAELTSRAQKHTSDLAYLVKGTVVSALDNKAVPYAIIKVKNTNIEVYTDTEGSFEILVPEGLEANLVVSQYGMETKSFLAKESQDNIIELHAGFQANAQNKTVSPAVIAYEREAAMESTPSVSKKNNNEIAQPVIGTEAYNKYLDSHALLPEASELESAEVLLSFYIDKNGNPYRFKVIDSPGKEYSDLAIKVVEDGPKWIVSSGKSAGVTPIVRLKVILRKP